MSSKNKLRKIGRSDKAARHIRLYHWVLETEAWQSLTPVDRALYIALLARYGGPGSNNGRISYSVREAAEELHIGKSATADAFRRLTDRGFINVMQKGRFDRKIRHATEYRLCEFPCDITGELATKDFARWRDQKENTVPESGLTGISGRTLGPSDRTVNSIKAAHGT